ncbi:2-(1,2-epoxy-1,2-dihydrophenyl)acetyl-CoA isomerase [Dyadobacter luteus]|jgi:2-(1,2-epoxy-1,2-dihydrophenyl)acetyl-CoA isomerase|uniref:2-(1,2-epoxy-1,2-dihydrophenyl)acetyl-CoA isomerase n=1 Tax=Dyadobacter luteus TaxID=2259619 RepID=A0A3D8Y8Y4_9BACT|nr:enoyl-CoA hydratase-related protein [Dyadobacter luteus]REA59869.1 2-(1,2-epoxy-1,2-dihydrophenyl)acetyl-CoA isomerase [Dyadobacter luteus]
MYQYLISETTDGVARLTLNRPEVYHALNPGLLQELLQAVETAAADESVRVLLLTATGNKAFCSGADLTATMRSGKSAGELLRAYYNPLIIALRTIPKPVVCRLNGLAAGAGASLALACDVVIAQEQAYLSQIFVKIGLMPDAGATFFLPRLIGFARAFEIATTGRNVYAPEAAQIGLITRSVPEAELDRAVAQTIGYYRNAPTQAIAAIKEAFNQSYQSNLAAMLELEAAGQDKLSKTSDAAEGIQSFIHKRKPDFQGS